MERTVPPRVLRRPSTVACFASAQRDFARESDGKNLCEHYELANESALDLALVLIACLSDWP